MSGPPAAPNTVYGDLNGSDSKSRLITIINIFTAAQLSSSNAFWTVGAQMAKSEGVLSLMNGLTASMMREIVYSGIRMGTYEYFKYA